MWSKVGLDNNNLPVYDRSYFSLEEPTLIDMNLGLFSAQRWPYFLDSSSLQYIQQPTI